MGASKNFFNELREGDEYANVTLRMNPLRYIMNEFNEGNHYTINNVKQKNSVHDKDEELMSLYKERSKIQRKIVEREQKLNHEDS